MEILFFGDFELFDSNKKLIRSKYIEIGEYYVVSPFNKKVICADYPGYYYNPEENPDTEEMKNEKKNTHLDVYYSDYHDSNVYVSEYCYNNGKHTCANYMLCYGMRDKYCVKQITQEDAKKYIEEKKYKSVYELKEEYNYFIIQIIKITHLIKTETWNKIFMYEENREWETNYEKLPFSEVDMYDYGKDYGYEDEYECCNDPGFYYKGECEHCGNKYIDISLGD